jgi:hypothetical protein
MANYEIDSFKNIQELIRFIDQKAAVLLVVNGLLLTIFFQTYLDDAIILLWNQSVGATNGISCCLYRCVYFLSGISYFVCSCFVVYMSLAKVLCPRLAREDCIKGDLFYFQSIAKMPIDDYKERCLSADAEHNLKVHVLEQTHVVSGVLVSKTKELKRSIYTFLTGAFSFIIFCIMNSFPISGG